MAIEKFKTQFPGVRYRKHSTRKHGVKFDQYFFIRYQKDGKRVEEGLGWSSEGWSAEKANEVLAELKKAARTGEGAQRLQEKRAIEENRRREEQARIEQEEKKSITIDDYFKGPYLDDGKLHKKPRTVGSEEALYNTWIEPVVGKLPIKDLTDWHFQQIKAKVMKAGRSARTVHYVASVLIQLWGHAHNSKDRLIDSPPPRRKDLKLPTIDNERTRAFTQEQARQYFEAIKSRSRLWHDISMLSLLAGLRASECFKLEIHHFDEERRQIFLVTPKKAKSQYLPLNDAACDLLKQLKDEHPSKTGLFFKVDRGKNKGKQITEVSNTVERVIEDLGFNAEISDKRDKLTFHSWRHSYATWLLEEGASLYEISQLLRHSTLAMTKRYSHLSQESLRNTSQKIGEALQRGQKDEGNDASSVSESG
ncbi:MAG: tyrosine-type recombinase/integrase [Deltaproteobacteria bacterium]|nr:tyrosine-type recombinase/integrase [Deltaproteobacteria bacterium]